MVVAPTGDVLVEAGTEPDVLSAVLERDVLDEAREQNPSLRNRRM
jgi:predicted amidohydrolase